MVFLEPKLGHRVSIASSRGDNPVSSWWWPAGSSRGSWQHDQLGLDPRGPGGVLSQCQTHSNREEGGRNTQKMLKIYKV